MQVLDSKKFLREQQTSSDNNGPQRQRKANKQQTSSDNDGPQRQRKANKQQTGNDNGPQKQRKANKTISFQKWNPMVNGCEFHFDYGFAPQEQSG